MAEKVLLIVAGLCALQASRIGLKSLVFGFAEKTLVSDAVFNIAFTSVVIGALIAVTRIRNCRLAFLPEKVSIPYVLVTIVVVAIFLSTPFITQSTELVDVLLLIYGAALTPVYEELLFRGFIWRAVSVRSDGAAYIVSTLLFALWHVGYMDTVMWRTALFFPEANVFEIMLWKVVTGLVFGVILGAVRYRARNVYAPTLLHCVLNTVGG